VRPCLLFWVANSLRACQIGKTGVPAAVSKLKGEVLIAIANEPRLQLSDMRAALRAKGLSNLSAPRELRIVRSIPKLGTGKTDYRELARVLGDESAPVAA
jgi:acyl-[acyl-carrier-protein]-phospholipid O-acyltransferase/long-chain-fatty-acid--[acyl-carrier-protein] ligase